jgi:hypothetical protein
MGVFQGGSCRCFPPGKQEHPSQQHRTPLVLEEPQVLGDNMIALPYDIA